MSDGPRQTLDPDVPIVLYVDASWEVGGLVKYVIDLARGFLERGYGVAAICNTAWVVAPMREALADAGVLVHAIENDDKSLFGRLGRLRAFTSVVRQYRGCVLALIMGYASRGGPVTLAGVLGRAGAIVRADLQSPIPPVSARSKLFVKLSDLVIDRVIVGSSENRAAFVRDMSRSGKKMEVVHTGIDLNDFDPRRVTDARPETLGIAPDAQVVGTVSRLSEERKGVGFFLDMASQLAPRYPRAHFLVVGDGSLRSRLEEQAEALGIRERVTFTGVRSDVPALLRAMAVFVMPSLFEGGPTTVLEAMAMGTPVVATSVGMVPEVIEPGTTGMIVKPGDPAALANAVSTLLVDDELRARIGKQAEDRAHRSFSQDKMVDGYLEVFAAALASPARRVLRPRALARTP